MERFKHFSPSYNIFHEFLSLNRRIFPFIAQTLKNHALGQRRANEQNDVGLTSANKSGPTHACLLGCGEHAAVTQQLILPQSHHNILAQIYWPNEISLKANYLNKLN